MGCRGTRIGPLLATFDLAWEYPLPPHDSRLRYQFASADWEGFQQVVDRTLDDRLARRLLQIRTVKTPLPEATTLKTVPDTSSQSG